jgi:hypothetical protein
MDFAKLASVLTSRSLFFPSAVELAKTDRYEGLLRIPKTPPPLHPQIVAIMAHLTGAPSHQVVTDLQRIVAEGWQFQKPVPPYIFINSWHMNDDESDAMWKVYARDTYGAAIRTTFEKLTACFTMTDHDIFIGAVRYIDYEKDLIDHSNAFNRFLYKRKAFAHEREVRAVCQPLEVFAQMEKDWTVPDLEMQRAKEVNERLLQDGGLAVPIDVPALVDAIVLSPASPPWLADVVRHIVSALGFDLEVVWSDMQTILNDD